MTSKLSWQRLLSIKNNDQDGFFQALSQFIHIEDDDLCFHLMEWLKGGGYKDSEANSVILNFKNKPQAKGSNPRFYKDRAIKQFAQDLKRPIEKIAEKHSEKSIFVSFIPTSVPKEDEDYDDRFERVCHFLKEQILQNTDNIFFEQPIIVNKKRKRSSQGGRFRGDEYVKKIKESFKWKGFSSEPDVVIIFDDVVTTGAQFKACKELMAENLQKKPTLIGLFWAKAVDKESL